MLKYPKQEIYSVVYFAERSYKYFLLSFQCMHLHETYLKCSINKKIGNIRNEQLVSERTDLRAADHANFELCVQMHSATKV